MAQRVDLSPSQRTALMEEYKVLPAFPDVVPALEQLQNSDLQLYAFSNGSARAVSGLLENSNIIQWFDGVVSCEDVKMFKPNPVVYAHFNGLTQSEKSSSWLISGNSFDVLGAMNYGMKGIWVRRSKATILTPGIWNQPIQFSHSKN